MCYNYAKQPIKSEKNSVSHGDSLERGRGGLARGKGSRSKQVPCALSLLALSTPRKCIPATGSTSYFLEALCEGRLQDPSYSELRSGSRSMRRPRHNVPLSLAVEWG